MDRKPLNILGIDMGGTKIALCLGNDSGKILGDVRFDNRNTDPEVILPQLVQAAKDLAAGAGLAVSDIDCFGISSPSPADIPNGIITTPPNNPYWRNVPIKQYLKEQLGIDGYFDNDANAGALAEWFFGAGKEPLIWSILPCQQVSAAGSSQAADLSAAKDALPVSSVTL
jgi:glucokinase